MKKKRKLKKKFIVLIILTVFLLLLLGALALYMFVFKDKSQPKTIKPTSKMAEYGYTLETDQTKLYKDLYKELEDVLNKEEVNYDEYAKLIAQLAVADFYNLDNKVSKNDIGATEFIISDYLDNFVLEASETVYKYIQVNTDGKRNQTLPIVTNTEIDDLKQEKYQYKNIKDDKAYIAKVKVTYEKDLGYPKTVEIRMIHNDKKLEIYKMK